MGLEQIDNSPIQKKVFLLKNTNTDIETDLLNYESSATMQSRELQSKYDLIMTSSYQYIVPVPPATASYTDISQIKQYIQIMNLPKTNLRAPIHITVEPDEDGFIAKTIDLPLYGYGDEREEAINELKHEIESLYDDLMTDDNFTEEWLERKKLLKTWMKD